MTTRIILGDRADAAREGLRGELHAQPDMEVIGEAADAQSLVDLAANLLPDVVVMDVSIQPSIGFEAVSQLLRVIPKVKVIFMSLQTDRRYLEHAFRSGVSGYLLKEWAHEEIAEAVRMVAGEGRYLSHELSLETT